MSYKLSKILVDILKEAGAPSAAHEELRSDISAWAKDKGFIFPALMANGCHPDVILKDDNGNLFCGDAKIAENETIKNAETVQRIGKYIAEFASLLRNKSYCGGIIAVGTNSREEAGKWVETLNTLAAREGIFEEGAERNPPNFQVVKLNRENTWLTYW